jgi:hypothetical protein
MTAANKRNMKHHVITSGQRETASTHHVHWYLSPSSGLYIRASPHNCTVCWGWYNVQQRCTPVGKSLINMTWLVLSISDWTIIMTSGCPWPSATVKSPGFFKLGSCFSFFLETFNFLFLLFLCVFYYYYYFV